MLRNMKRSANERSEGAKCVQEKSVVQVMTIRFLSLILSQT